MRRTAILVLIAAATIALVAGLWRLGAMADRPARRPNILLISLDTVRADHLGCYSHPQIKTPHIDRLAAEGTYFEQCTTVAPLTLPAHASLMTATYPFVHGARDNNQFFVHENNVTLAEALRAAGYVTAAQVAATVMGRPYQLDQGFDSYEDVDPARVRAPERRADDVTERAAHWLREHARSTARSNGASGPRPFFLFVHYFDAHQPFEPPEPFARQYELPYLGEIAFIDEQIGRLLSVLDELGLDDETLIVLTADHGESLREHGEDTHGAFIYDSTTHIPLIFRWPGRVPVGVRVAWQTRLIDVAPTILDLAGVAPLKDAQGMSLTGAFSGGGDPGLWAYSEAMHPLLNLGFSQLRSIRGGGWKYIHAPRPELYHVADDPGETRNLADAEPARAVAMREELRRLIDSSPPIVSADAAHRELDAGETAALVTLGYVAGETGFAWDPNQREIDLFEPAGADPKDRAREIDRINECIALVDSRRFAEAESVLQSLIAAAPDGRASYMTHWLLARSMTHLDRNDEAIEQYRRALALRPDHVAALQEFGMALRRTGRFDEAVGVLERRLTLKPVYAVSHVNLALALFDAGRLHAALTQVRKAIELEPSSARAHAIQAGVLDRLGRHDEARASIRRALEIEPGNADFARQEAALGDR